MRTDPPERLRRVNPFPDELPAPTIQPLLERLEAESGTPAADGPRRLTARQVIALAPVLASIAVVASVATVILVLGHRSASHTATKPFGGPVASPFGPVPTGFEPISVTAVDRDSWWVLGTRPCAQRRCAAIVRTIDRGRHFAAVAAPAVPLFSPSGPVISQIRFADRVNGFAFGGSQLWATHDGGTSWHRVNLGGEVDTLATAGGEAYALVGTNERLLMRSPAAGDHWVALRTVTCCWLGAHGNDVLAATSAHDLLVSHDRGAHFTAHREPQLAPYDGCDLQEVDRAMIWAICGVAHSGAVLRSTDGGRSFRTVLGPQNAGTGVLALISARSALAALGHLVATTDAGAHWQSVGPLLEWQSLDARHGVGLATTGQNPNPALYVTSDGDVTFHRVAIESAPASATCRFTVTYAGSNGGAGSVWEFFRVSNMSSQRCALSRYPRVRLFTRDGQRLRAPQSDSPPPVFSPHPICSLEASGSGRFTVIFRGHSPNGTPAATSAVVELSPREFVRVTLPMSINPCPDGYTVVRISHISGTR